MARPKHSKGRPDGQRSVGHPRWARAAGNAALRPNSKSARLYLTRVTKAFAIAEAVRNGEDEFGLDARQPYAHWDHRYSWEKDKETGRYKSVRKLYRSAVTCGVHCMVMQVQLHTSDIASALTIEIADPKTGETRRKIEAVDKKTLRVGQRCIVCDSVIRSR